jgi:hypothetical protein
MREFVSDSWGCNNLWLERAGTPAVSALRPLALFAMKLGSEMQGQEPLQNPTKFELVVNLKTATGRSLGLVPLRAAAIPV